MDLPGPQRVRVCRRSKPRARRPASRCTAPASTRAASPNGSRSRCPRCAATSGTSAPRSSPTSATTRPRWSCARSCCSARTPETAKASPMLEVLGHGFMQSIDMIAAELGFATRRREARVARDGRDDEGARHARSACSMPARSPRSGSRGKATVDGEVVITVRVNWLMGEADLDPPWTFGRAALRGRVRRRSAARGHVPRPAPAGDRRAPGDRAHGAGDALRERDPLRRARRRPASRPTSICRSSPAGRRRATAARRAR